jgi:hypothetical protein
LMDHPPSASKILKESSHGGVQNCSDLLFHQVWYNRHMNTRYKIKAGEIKIVEKETFPV